MIGGLQASPALIAHDGDQEGVAIELSPLGCRALLRMPAGALWNTSVEGDEVLGRVATELRERLLAVAGWTDRFAMCDDVLGRLVGAHGPVAPELREAWRLLEVTGGAVPVTRVAADVGWSRRHLAERFAGEFGLSPKLAGRVMRFERARRLL